MCTSHKGERGGRPYIFTDMKTKELNDLHFFLCEIDYLYPPYVIIIIIIINIIVIIIIILSMIIMLYFFVLFNNYEQWNTLVL